jgi:hypothetical protein
MTKNAALPAAAIGLRTTIVLLPVPDHHARHDHGDSDRPDVGNQIVVANAPCDASSPPPGTLRPMHSLARLSLVAQPVGAGHDTHSNCPTPARGKSPTG